MMMVHDGCCGYIRRRACEGRMNGREGTWTGTDAVEDPKANSEQFQVMVVVVVVVQ